MGYPESDFMVAFGLFRLLNNIILSQVKNKVNSDAKFF